MTRTIEWVDSDGKVRAYIESELTLGTCKRNYVVGDHSYDIRRENGETVIKGRCNCGASLLSETPEIRQPFGFHL